MGEAFRTFWRNAIAAGIAISALATLAIAAVHVGGLRDEVRRVAGHFLACPPGEVELDSWEGDDVIDAFVAVGCGGRGLVTCDGAGPCAFHVPEGEGFAEIGTVVPADTGPAEAP
jgi:hypothetical protein